MTDALPCIPLSHQRVSRRPFVYLAYLDDSGTRQKDRAFQVLCAVVIKDTLWEAVEAVMCLPLDDLLPEDKINKFEEFHAWELFGGHGVFEGVPQPARFKAIEFLLRLIREYKIPIVYGAVNHSQLKDTVYGSAEPLDIAFRICAKGIEDWIKNNSPKDFALLIADDSDNKTKALLRQSFRHMRKPMRPPRYESGELWHMHDDMYFGDSKDSVGIQLADLCAYFIAKHLQGDPAGEGFYEIIKDQIVYSKVEPE